MESKSEIRAYKENTRRCRKLEGIGITQVANSQDLGCN